MDLSPRRMEFGGVAYFRGQVLQSACKVKNKTVMKINLGGPWGRQQAGGRHTGS